MTGTSSQREREDSDARNPTYLLNRFNGSLFREMMILHSLDNKLQLALQTDLGIAVRAAVNMSELTQILLSFQVLPNEEMSRKWLLKVCREWRAVAACAAPAFSLRFARRWRKGHRKPASNACSSGGGQATRGPTALITAMWANCCTLSQ